MDSKDIPMLAAKLWIKVYVQHNPSHGADQARIMADTAVAKFMESYKASVFNPHKQKV